MITQERIDEIKARDAAATPGPWGWDLRRPTNTYGHECCLINSGRLLIMDFVRTGMQGAEPRFARRENNDGRWTGGIMRNFIEWHTQFDVAPPDALFIAHARQDVTDLLTEIERLRAENAALRSQEPIDTEWQVLRDAVVTAAREWGACEDDSDSEPDVKLAKALVDLREFERIQKAGEL